MTANFWLLGMSLGLLLFGFGLAKDLMKVFTSKNTACAVLSTIFGVLYYVILGALTTFWVMAIIHSTATGAIVMSTVMVLLCLVCLVVNLCSDGQEFKAEMLRATQSEQ